MTESASFEERLYSLRALLDRAPDGSAAAVDLSGQRQRLEQARARVVARLREATEAGDQVTAEDLKVKARALAEKISLMSAAAHSSVAGLGELNDSALREQIVSFLSWAKEQQAPLSVDDRAHLQSVAASLVRKRRDSLQTIEHALQAARKHALQGVVLIRDLRSLVDEMPRGNDVMGLRRLPFEPQRQLAANQFGLCRQAVDVATLTLRTTALQWPELRAFAALPDWAALPFDELMTLLVPSGELASPVEATRLAMLQRLREADDLGAATALWLSELSQRAAALPGPAPTTTTSSAELPRVD